MLSPRINKPPPIIRKAISYTNYENSPGIYDNNSNEFKALTLAIRKFVFTSYREFKKLIDEFSNINIFNTSRELRMKLKDLANDFYGIYYQINDHNNNSINNINMQDNDNQKLLDDIKEIYYRIIDMEKKWHFCEIFHLNSNKLLSLEMCNWLDEYLDVLEYDENFRYFKSLKQPESNEDYLPLVINCCMRGQLDYLINLLQIHSVINNISNSKKKDTNDLRLSINNFIEILREYPNYRDTYNNNNNNNNDQQLDLRKVSTDFKLWYEKVRKFQQTSTKLITYVPEMAIVINILVGDHDTLISYCDNSWEKLTLALLLYVYPPPLTKIDLSKIVGDAMDALTQDDIVVKNIMVGMVTTVLQEFYEHKGGFFSEISTVCLVNAAHLTLILAKGAHMTYFTDNKVNSSTDSSFCEELFIELGDRLNYLEYPIDVVVFYFYNCCETKKFEYLRHLLPRRQITCDEDAIEISSNLRALGLIDEARAVEVSRGTWWLQSSNSPESTVAIKALYFYQLANDRTRSQAIIDRALWGCTIAVYASTYFDDLSFKPSKPCDGSFKYAIYDDQMYLEGNNDMKNNRLFLSLMKADELIGTIKDDAAEVKILAQNLNDYVKVIRLRLKLEVMRNDEEALQILKSCGNSIYNLLENAYNNVPGINMRYWLHLIDLCAWFDDEFKLRCHNINNTSECTMFSKKEVYIMLQAMESILQSYGSSHIINQQEIIQEQEQEQEQENIKKLRMKLLGLLTASIVQFNASSKNEVKASSFIIPKSNFSSNYHILTANSSFK